MSMSNLFRAVVIVSVAVGGFCYLNRKGKEAIEYFKEAEANSLERLERQLNAVKCFAAKAGYKMDEADLIVVGNVEKALLLKADLVVTTPLHLCLGEIFDKITLFANTSEKTGE